MRALALTHEEQASSLVAAEERFRLPNCPPSPLLHCRSAIKRQLQHVVPPKVAATTSVNGTEHFGRGICRHVRVVLHVSLAAICFFIWFAVFVVAASHAWPPSCIVLFTTFPPRYPLDVIKTRAQLGHGNSSFGTIVSSLRTIVQTEGVRNLYRGISAPMSIEPVKRVRSSQSSSLAPVIAALGCVAVSHSHLAACRLSSSPRMNSTRGWFLRGTGTACTRQAHLPA